MKRYFAKVGMPGYSTASPPFQTLWGFQNVGYHRPSGATDALGHAQASTLDLIHTGLASQLLHQLDDLIDARGSYWIPPRLQPPHSANGDAAIQGDFSFMVLECPD